MPKYFNVTGLCVPDKHYMVNRAECVRRIQRMVDAGDYFTMNRARQYGKTTTLFALAKALARSKLVISLDFQALGSMSFQSENKFSLAFLRIFLREMKRQQIAGMGQLLAQMQNHQHQGYLVSFNFNKKKQIGVFERKIGNIRLIEAVV